MFRFRDSQPCAARSRIDFFLVNYFRMLPRTVSLVSYATFHSPLICAGAGNFLGGAKQRTFCPTFPKFARKMFMWQTFFLQNFSSCWYIIFSSTMLPLAGKYKIWKGPLEIWFLLTQLKKVGYIRLCNNIVSS